MEFKEQKQAYIEYITVHKAECEKTEHTLREEERSDEANLEKVKWNIYDIFGIMVNSTEKRMQVSNESGTDAYKEQFKKEFLKTMDRILQPWRKQYEMAKEHNRADQEVIEEIKLAAADELIEKFKETFC